MPGQRWPTLEETLRAAREGVVEDSMLRERPEPETLDAIRADLEQFEARFRRQYRQFRQFRHHLPGDWTSWPS